MLPFLFDQIRCKKIHLQAMEPMELCDAWLVLVNQFAAVFLAKLMVLERYIS